MCSYKEKVTVKNKSAVKALDIIEFLSAGRNEPQRLQDIADGLSMNVSTVLRFLTAMIECGYVDQDPITLRYSLTMKICAIANKVSSNTHLYDVVLPYMKQIRQDLEESVCLAIEENYKIVYIGVVQGPDQILRTMQRIGNIAPMHCTGIGKLLLCSHSEAEVEQLIKHDGLTIFTRNTPCTREQLWKELKFAQNNGYALDDEECEIGARCVAVPLYDYAHKAVAGLSVTGTIFRLTDEKIKKCIPYLLQKSAEISKALGYLA